MLMNILGHSFSHQGAIRKGSPVIIRNPRKIDEIVFIPPDAKDVERLLDELLNFINTNIV